MLPAAAVAALAALLCSRLACLPACLPAVPETRTLVQKKLAGLSRLGAVLFAQTPLPTAANALRTPAARLTRFG